RLAAGDAVGWGNLDESVAGDATTDPTRGQIAPLVGRRVRRGDDRVRVLDFLSAVVGNVVPAGGRGQHLGSDPRLGTTTDDSRFDAGTRLRRERDFHRHEQ